MSLGFKRLIDICRSHCRGGLARRKVSTYTGQLRNSENADIENIHYVSRSVCAVLFHGQIYSIPTHDEHQWLLLQFIVLLMMDAKGVRNM